MYIPDDVICEYCHEIFCCDKCRYKHELKSHLTKISQLIPMPNITQNENQNVGRNDQPHHIETIFMFCPICENRPLPLRSDLHQEILNHLHSHHLPLKCQKCSKVYQKIDDIMEFTKCVQTKSDIQHEHFSSINQSRNNDEASNFSDLEKVAKSLSTQTPIWRQDFYKSCSRRQSIADLPYKSKCEIICEGLLTDSVSSIKNISSASNCSMKESSNKASKLIRSTSTPVQLEMLFPKPREQTFNASDNGQVSSILSSDCELDNTPAMFQTNGQTVGRMNCFCKPTGVRSKMKTITPLRQVMCRSIKRAFVEHSFVASTETRRKCSSYQPINTAHCSNLYNANVDIAQSSSPQPLDLRLSSVIRRTQSETEEVLKNQICPSYVAQNKNRNILLSSQKVTTESILITRTESSATSTINENKNGETSTASCSSTNSSYRSTVTSCVDNAAFKSCSSLKIITETTELNQVQFQSDRKKIIDLETRKDIYNHPNQNLEFKKNINNHSIALTPITRIPGALINKKLINFETPLRNATDSLNSSAEIFFTPNATPMRKNSSTREISVHSERTCRHLSSGLCADSSAPLKECIQSNELQNIDDDNISDEVFLTEKEMKTETKNQKHNIWSLMSSVIRLPSFISTSQKELCAKTTAKTILKKCASIGGSTMTPLNEMEKDEIQSTKRKRSNTIANQINYPLNSAVSAIEHCNASSKRFCIQSRRPLDRMLLNKR
uniref:Uncharacterized protein n=1 Tax=Glossina brevipalpis TaxID=37001 RepID=A0A1A9X0B2_9MUSC